MRIDDEITEQFIRLPKDKQKEVLTYARSIVEESRPSEAPATFCPRAFDSAD